MSKSDDLDDNYTVLQDFPRRESLMRIILSWASKYEDEILVFASGFFIASTLWLFLVWRVVKHYESKVQELSGIAASFTVEVDEEFD